METNINKEEKSKILPIEKFIEAWNKEKIGLDYYNKLKEDYIITERDINLIKAIRQIILLEGPGKETDELTSKYLEEVIALGNVLVRQQQVDFEPMTQAEVSDLMAIFNETDQELEDEDKTGGDLGAPKAY